MLTKKHKSNTHKVNKQSKLTNMKSRKTKYRVSSKTSNHYSGKYLTDPNKFIKELNLKLEQLIDKHKIDTKFKFEYINNDDNDAIVKYNKKLKSFHKQVLELLYKYAYHSSKIFTYNEDESENSVTNKNYKKVIDGIIDAGNTYNVSNANLNQMDHALDGIHFAKYKFKNFIDSHNMKMSADPNYIQKTYSEDKTCVAVIIMHGYGGGFSSDNPDNPWFIYGDPVFVKMVLDKVDNGTICDYISRKIPSKSFNMYPTQSLHIEWVPVKSTFKIREYDGFEYVEILDVSEWFTA